MNKLRKLIVAKNESQLTHRMRLEVGKKFHESHRVEGPRYSIQLLVARPNDERVMGQEYQAVEYLLGVPLDLRQQYELRKR